MSIQIEEGAFVSADCDIRGDVQIGKGSFVHPLAEIHAKNGPITIGNDCLIEARVRIVNEHTQPMLIGDRNVFETASSIQSPRIGNDNVFEIRSEIGPEVIIKDDVIIGIACKIFDRNEIGPNLVIYGPNLIQRRKTDKVNASNHLELEYLHRTVSQYITPHPEMSMTLSTLVQSHLYNIYDNRVLRRIKSFVHTNDLIMTLINLF